MVMGRTALQKRSSVYTDSADVAAMSGMTTDEAYKTASLDGDDKNNSITEKELNEKKTSKEIEKENINQTNKGISENPDINIKRSPCFNRQPSPFDLLKKQDSKAALKKEKEEAKAQQKTSNISHLLRPPMAPEELVTVTVRQLISF